MKRELEIHVVGKRRGGLLGALLIVNMLMATRMSLSSCSLLLKHTCPPPRLFAPKHLRKSHPCPLWSSSFSLCLHKSTITTSSSSSSFPPSLSVSSCSSFSSAPSMAATSASDDSIHSNPLLQDFDFPPFDVVEVKHVRPGIRSLLKKLVRVVENFIGFP